MGCKMDYEILREEFILDQDWSNKTVVWARRLTVIFFERAAQDNVQLATMSSGQFTRLLTRMRRESYSYSARVGLYNVISAFCRWLKQNGHIDYNIFAHPDTKPKRPKQPRKVVRTVPLEYVEAMIRYASTQDEIFAKRDVAILLLMITTGMRRMEVVELAMPDIDFIRGEVLLVATKNRDERYVFLRDDAAEALQAWLAVRPKVDHNKVFLSLNMSRGKIHNPLWGTSLNNLFQRLKIGAGIPKDVKVTPHMLRHTFATEVAKSGHPFALQQLLGHSDIKTTQIYIHANKETLRDVSAFAPKVKKPN